LSSDIGTVPQSGLFLSGFPPMSLVPHTCHMQWPSSSSWLVTRTIFGAEYRSWISSLCSRLQPQLPNPL